MAVRTGATRSQAGRGPPAMIESAKSAFRAHGVQPDRLFYDSFEFGLDVPVRVLARPH